jgi:Tfp pilus assembly protein PilV
MRRAGFTILEVVLALLLVQVGVLAAAGVFYLAQESLVRAELTLRGLIEADWIGDSLATIAEPGPGSAQFPWGQVTWTQSQEVPGGWVLTSVATSGRDTLVVLPSLPVQGVRPLTETCGLGGPVRVKAP